MKISDAAAGFGIGLVTVYVAKLAMDGWRKTARDLVDASINVKLGITGICPWPQGHTCVAG